LRLHRLLYKVPGPEDGITLLQHGLLPLREDDSRQCERRLLGHSQSEHRLEVMYIVYNFVKSKLACQVALLNAVQDDIMHAPDGLVEVVDVDLENVIVELLALSDKVPLNRLVLPNLFVDIRLDVRGHVLL